MLRQFGRHRLRDIGQWVTGCTRGECWRVLTSENQRSRDDPYCRVRSGLDVERIDDLFEYEGNLHVQ